MEHPHQILHINLLIEPSGPVRRFLSHSRSFSLSADSLFAPRLHRHNKKSVGWSDNNLLIFFTIFLTRGP